MNSRCSFHLGPGSIYSRTQRRDHLTVTHIPGGTTANYVTNDCKTHKQDWRSTTTWSIPAQDWLVVTIVFFILSLVVTCWKFRTKVSLSITLTSFYNPDVLCRVTKLSRTSTAVIGFLKNYAKYYKAVKSKECILLN